MQLVQPTRTIDTGHGNNQPGQVVDDELYVSGLDTNTVEVYPRTAAGLVVPIRTLAGSTTGLGLPAPPYVTDNTGCSSPAAASAPRVRRTTLR